MMRILHALVLLSFLGLSSPLYAQSPPPLEAYGAMPTIDLMAISPKGERIAYRMTTADNDIIAVVDLESQQLVGGIAVGEIAARDLQFVDEDNLIIIAGRTSKMVGFRGKFDYSSAFRLHVPTRDIEQLLSRAPDLFPAQSGLGEIVAVFDKGERLLMPAYHIENIGSGDPKYGLYSVKLDDNRARLVEKGDHFVVDWFANGDGDAVARVDYNQQSNQYRIWSMTDGRDLIYKLETKILPTGPVGVVPSGDALVYVARPAGSDFPAFFRMSLKDGEITGPIMERDGSSVESVQSDLNRVVHGVEYSGFSPSYEFFDADLDARVRNIVNGLGGTSTRLVSWTNGFEDLLFRVGGGWNSGVYVLFRKGVDAPEVIAQVRPEIPNEQVVPTVVTSYTARDGLEIPALVTAKPELRERGNAPLLVIPHGGPASFDRLRFDWKAQYFASRGYVVLQPQFRGSSGFGQEFLRAGYGEWGGMMQTDIDDGVDHLIESGLVDPERVCIAGSSYGGYAALAAGAFSPGKYKCVASIAGVADLKRMLKDGRSRYGSNHWVISYWERQFGGDEFDRDALDDISPITFADKFEAPVLLIHGKKDLVVPIEQSKAMNKALRKAGKDVTLVELKGEDHYLSYSETRLATLQALAAFIEMHL